MKREDHQQITLEEYFLLAESVTGVAARELATNDAIQLAGSALAAPFHTFDSIEFYPDLFDKAAVLMSRLIQNHPLVDGNKRAAWATLDVFLGRHGHQIKMDLPGAYELVIGVAAGAVSEKQLSDWLQANTSAI